MDDKLWKFQFGLEVSILYHDWRRAFLAGMVRIIRAVTFVGAIIALTTVLALPAEAPTILKLLIALSSGVAALAALVDLVCNFDTGAREHRELYRRFMEVQRQMKAQSNDEDALVSELPTWESDVASIRSDEPPTMWAEYATCWNQVMDRHGMEQRGYYRQIGFVPYFLRHYVAFNPMKFRPE